MPAGKGAGAAPDYSRANFYYLLKSKTVRTYEELQQVRAALAKEGREPAKFPEAIAALEFLDAVAREDAWLASLCMRTQIYLLPDLQNYVHKHAAEYFANEPSVDNFGTFVNMLARAEGTEYALKAFQHRALSPCIMASCFCNFKSPEAMKKYVLGLKGGQGVAYEHAEHMYAAWVLGLITAEERDKGSPRFDKKALPKKSSRPRRKKKVKKAAR